MKALTFLIRSTEPLLVTQTQSGDANSGVTYPFIPGSTLRGAIIDNYLKEQELTKLDAGDPVIQNLFFNGNVCYLNAYLAHPENNSRALPRPLSWFMPKDEADQPNALIYDFAIQVQSWDEPPKVPDAGEFCWASDDHVILSQPKIQVTAHNFSDNRNRKAANISQVYRYDALAAGQLFAGVIISDNEKLLTQTIQPLLQKNELNLGRSRTAGYGQVEIFDIILDQDWREYSGDALGDTTPEDRWTEVDEDSEEMDFIPSSDQETSQWAVLTCLSDLIVRGQDGQVGASLAELVGCKTTEINTFQRVRVVGGFNRKWGLPLPQEQAIQAGSVFVFPVEYRSKLETWLETGLGERRTEGFGRVAVNWFTRPKLEQWPAPRRAITVVKPKKLSESSATLAQQMAQRQLQSQLDYKLVEMINNLSEDFRYLPRPAQLSRARLASRRAWLKNDLTEIKNHFEGLSDLTLREWAEAQIRGEHLKTWLLGQIEHPEQFACPVPLPKVAGEEADFAPLRHQTIARLIEGVLRRTVKYAKQQAEGGRP